MTFTDDPVADFLRHDAEQQAELDKLPRCADCGEPITDDHLFYINDETICPACMECYRRSVEEFID